MSLYLTLAAVMAVMIVTLWLISLKTGKVSFIDGFWGAGFVILAWVAAISGPGLENLGQTSWLLLAMISIWGGRLGLYLLRRFLHEGEDRRYRKMLSRNKRVPPALFTLVMVFLLQGSLILILSAPIVLFIGADTQTAGTPSLLALAGATLWVFGLTFEWTADRQLARFKSDPANADKVMDQGLWAWSRHPNYFGEACLWWGLWLVGHEPLYVFAPLFVTFTLMKWSGVPLNEAGIKKRRPGYEDYRARVSGFWPRPPRPPQTVAGDPAPGTTEFSE